MSEKPQDRRQPLEDALRQALRPAPPPAGFAERVLARVAEKERESAGASAPFPKSSAFAAWIQSLWFGGRGWAVALASLVLLLAATAWYQQESARKQAELQAQQEARQKALYALRLTGEKLAPARRALAELGIDIGPAGSGEPFEGNSAQ
jgi:hypothetical protein